MGIAKSLRKANYLSSVSEAIRSIVKKKEEEEKKQKQKEALEQIAKLYEASIQNVSGQNQNPFSSLVPEATQQQQQQHQQQQGIENVPQEVNNQPTNIDVGSISQIVSRDPAFDYFQGEVGKSTSPLQNTQFPQLPQNQHTQIPQLPQTQLPSEEKNKEKITPLEQYKKAQQEALNFYEKLAKVLAENKDYLTDEAIKYANTYADLMKQRTELLKPKERKYEQFDPEKDIAYMDEDGNLVVQRQGQKKLFNRVETMVIKDKPVLIGINDYTGETHILGVKGSKNSYNTSGNGSQTTSRSTSDKNSVKLGEFTEQLSKVLMPVDILEDGEQTKINPYTRRNNADLAVAKAIESTITDPELYKKIMDLYDEYGGRYPSPTDIGEKLENELNATQKRQLAYFLSLYNEGVYERMPFEFKMTKKNLDEYYEQYKNEEKKKYNKDKIN